IHFSQFFLRRRNFKIQKTSKNLTEERDTEFRLWLRCQFETMQRKLLGQVVVPKVWAQKCADTRACLYFCEIHIAKYFTANTTICQRTSSFWLVVKLRPESM